MSWFMSHHLQSVQNPTKTGAYGGVGFNNPGTALFSALTALPKLPSALKYLVQYCRLYLPIFTYLQNF